MEMAQFRYFFHKKCILSCGSAMSLKQVIDLAKALKLLVKSCKCAFNQKMDLCDGFSELRLFLCAKILRLSFCYGHVISSTLTWQQMQSVSWMEFWVPEGRREKKNNLHREKKKTVYSIKSVLFHLGPCASKIKICIFPTFSVIMMG